MGLSANNSSLSIKCGKALEMNVRRLWDLSYISWVDYDGNITDGPVSKGAVSHTCIQIEKVSKQEPDPTSPRLRGISCIDCSVLAAIAF